MKNYVTIARHEYHLLLLVVASLETSLGQNRGGCINLRTLICIELSKWYYIIDVHADISGTVSQQSSTGGAVYTRWGRKTCHGNGTDLLYWGTDVGIHTFRISPVLYNTRG